MSKAIGCNTRDMPKKEKIETNPTLNMLHVRSVCVPAILDGFCMPEKSHVDFVCKDGFQLDPSSG
jgi:hypothetical protein